jgi:hypothetical protein
MEARWEMGKMKKRKIMDGGMERTKNLRNIGGKTTKLERDCHGKKVEKEQI